MSDTSPNRLSAPHSLIIWIMLVATFVVMVNETILNVAVPSIMTDLAIDAATAQWLLTAYMLTMAVVIPISGFLLRRFSTRRVFIAAMLLFAIGTAVALVAPGFAALVVARVVQAAGAGVMLPLLMTTVLELVPPDQHGRMMGRVSLVIAAAPALGPLAGGIVISAWGWRPIFAIVLVIAIAAVALGLWRVRDVAAPERVPVDALSIVLSAFGFGGLILGLSEIGTAAEGGPVPVQPWIPAIIGVIALGFFIWRQLVLQRRDDALIDLRIFAAPGFVWPFVVTAVLCAILYGALVLLPIYLQGALGISALDTGLIVLPGGIVMAVAGPIVGRIYDRVGPRPLVVPGAILSTIALALMAWLYDGSTPVLLVAVVHTALCLGLALMFSPLFTAAMGSLPAERYSYGSAMLGTINQLAGAAGTAALVVVYTVAGGASSAVAGSPDAIVAGTRAAFLIATLAFVVVVGLAFLVRRPRSELSGAPAFAH